MALEPIQSRSALVERGGVVTGVWSRWFTALWTIVTRLDGGIRTGQGSPEGVVTAAGGTLYQRADGPPWLYVKESAATVSTGWRAL